MESFRYRMKSENNSYRGSRYKRPLCCVSHSTTQRSTSKEENKKKQFILLQKTGIEAVKTISDAPKMIFNVAFLHFY